MLKSAACYLIFVATVVIFFSLQVSGQGVPGPVKNLRVKQSDEFVDEVQLSFSCVPENERNGKITKYVITRTGGDEVVEHSQLPTDIETDCEEVVLGSSSIGYIYPTFTYSYKVVAKNDYGESRPVTFEIKAEMNNFDKPKFKSAAQTHDITMSQQRDTIEILKLYCLLTNDRREQQQKIDCTFVQLKFTVGTVDAKALKIVSKIIDKKVEIVMDTKQGDPVQIVYAGFQINDHFSLVRIFVERINLPPNFQHSSFVLEVPENLAANTALVTVYAEKDDNFLKAKGDVLINIYDGDLDEEFGIAAVDIKVDSDSPGPFRYEAINDNELRGRFYTNGENLIAGAQYKFNIVAEDKNDKTLRTETTFTFKVISVCEKCEHTVVKIPVELSRDKTITTVEYSKPLENTTFTLLEGGGGYFDVNKKTGDVILIRGLDEVNVKDYFLTIKLIGILLEGGRSYTVEQILKVDVLVVKKLTFNLNVHLIYGSLLAETGESIFLRCVADTSADLSDFTFRWYQDNQYTNDEGVELQMLDVKTKETGRYSCRAVDVFSRSTNSANSMYVEVYRKLYKKSGDVEMVVQNLNWVDELADPTSDYYLVGKSVLEKGIDFAMVNKRGYEKCEIKRMRQGSIILDVTVFERDSSNSEGFDPDDIVKQPDLSNFFENWNFTVVQITSTNRTDPIEIGQGAEFSCKAAMFSSHKNTNVFVQWKFNGDKISPSAQFDIIATVTSSRAVDLSSFDEKASQTYVSTIETTLKVSKMSKIFIGSYSCEIDYVEVMKFPAKHTTELTSDDVLQYPAITLSPLKAYITEQNTRFTFKIDDTLGNRGSKKDISCFRDGIKLNVKIIEGELTVIVSDSTEVFCQITETAHRWGRKLTAETTKAKTKLLIFETILCPYNKVDGITWYEAYNGTTAKSDCGKDATGETSRPCSKVGTWGVVNYADCVKKVFEDVKERAELIKSGVGVNEKNFTNVSKETLNIVKDIGEEDLNSGDIAKSAEILDKLAQAALSTDDGVVNTTTLQNLANIADILLLTDDEQWQLLKEYKEEKYNNLTEPTGFTVVLSIEKIAVSSLKSDNVTEIVLKTVAIKTGKSNGGDINFPDSSSSKDSWVADTKITAFLSGEALRSEDDAKYSIILFKKENSQVDVKPNLQREYGEDPTLQSKVINSELFSFSLLNNTIKQLSSPLMIKLPALQKNYKEPSCAYINTSKEVDGVWSTAGCETVIEDGIVSCLCNHLTNFAVLMSPSRPDDAHADILSIISIVGCSVSIVCLILTVAVHVTFWQHIKADRTALHVHLSICLILAYGVFIGGVNRTENEIVCTVVSALLHFLFLSVFFIMLAEGVEVFMSVTVVFARESNLWKFLVFSYGVPFGIVAATLGVTQAEGYGNDNFCWLTLESGLFWAFVGPALLVIGINLLVMLCVIRAVVHSNSVRKKTINKENVNTAKSVVKTIVCLSPILGVTWVFGVLSVNSDLVYFQYLFAICNSLQGFFIFLFYCVFNDRIREQYKNRRQRQKAKSFDSGGIKSSTDPSRKYSTTDPIVQPRQRSASTFSAITVLSNGSDSGGPNPAYQFYQE